MSDRKYELHISQSFKFFDPTPSYLGSTIEKERYSFRNQNNGSNQSTKFTKKTQRENKNQNKLKNQQKVLNQRNENGQTKKLMISKGTIDQSLLGRLKKLGYVSNPVSKPSSPNRKKINQVKTHRRNISANDSHLEKFKNQILTNSSTHLFNKLNFQYKHVIGRGGFGKVWKVQLKKSKKIYAMKQMSKALVITKKSVPSVMNEKRLLQQLNNDFIVNMVHSFQDRDVLYLVMDYLPGGDLRHHIARRRKFSEEQAKFIICCILLGLTFLHEHNIIHRDIKPENLVLDAQGYIRVTDLGIARNYRPNNAQDTSGTPGYMAPQVLCRQNHTFSVDYFALGVIAYQLMLRKRPYSGRNRKQIRDQILARQIQIKRNDIPQNWSMESADFINRLLQRKPTNRLGSSGSQQIRNHPWLRMFPFDKLARKQLAAPYIPDPSLADQSFDSANFSQENTEVKQLMYQNELILRNPQVQQLFEGYQSHKQV